MVEDEELILELMVEALEDAGYDVMTATSGPQALATIIEHGDRLSGLFSDFHLPGGLTGLDVATALRTHRPGMPVLLATGRPDLLDDHRMSTGGFVLLRKPYGPLEMIGALGRLVPPHRPSP